MKKNWHGVVVKHLVDWFKNLFKLGTKRERRRAKRRWKLTAGEYADMAAGKVRERCPHLTGDELRAVRNIFNSILEKVT